MSALRHISSAQAASVGRPSLTGSSTSESRKASTPTLKTKATRASYWFWVSAAETRR